MAWRVFSRLQVFGLSSPPRPALSSDSGFEPSSFGAQYQVIGHRGSGLPSTEKGGKFIGNTLNAIDAGIQAGVNWVEIDVRATAGPEPKLVVFHDEDLDDRTNGSGPVSECHPADISGLFTYTDPKEKISTLDEVFERFPQSDLKWILDIKAADIHDEVMEWLGESLQSGLISKDRLILFGTYNALVEYKDSGFKLGYTVLGDELVNQFNVLLNQSQIIRRAERLGCKQIVLPVLFANQGLISEATQNGFEVWIYGVMNVDQARTLASRGASGFIVDRPEIFTGIGLED